MEVDNDTYMFDPFWNDFKGSMESGNLFDCCLLLWYCFTLIDKNGSLLPHSLSFCFFDDSDLDMNKFLAKGVIEFLAVLLGISASFWLNELSIENQNERERKKVLKSLQIEINEIKNYCDERKRTWAKDIALLNEFLNDKSGSLDIKSILSMTTSKIRIETFMVLTESLIPMNRYYSIINARSEDINSNSRKKVV